MANFYAQYPASASGSNASVGVNGGPAPGSSTEIAGVAPGDILTPVSVDSGGNQNVNVVNSTLPTGGATAANQVIENGYLSDIDTNIAARLTGSLVPTAFNEQVLTYVGTTTQIATVTYKLGGTTVKTLTLTYDSNTPPRVIDVVAT